jgi:excisionase family DNA binding protein
MRVVDDAHTKYRWLQVVSRKLEDAEDCDLDAWTPKDPVTLSFTDRPDLTPEYIDVKDAGKIVRLHPKVIRRAIDDGELPAYKLRSKIRIRRSDLDAWIESCKVQPYEPAGDLSWP